MVLTELWTSNDRISSCLRVRDLQYCGILFYPEFHAISNGHIHFFRIRLLKNVNFLPIFCSYSFAWKRQYFAHKNFCRALFVEPLSKSQSKPIELQLAIESIELINWLNSINWVNQSRNNVNLIRFECYSINFDWYPINFDWHSINFDWCSINFDLYLIDFDWFSIDFDLVKLPNN